MCINGVGGYLSPVDLMKRDLGVEIDARLMKMFIRVNWNKLAKCAHQIHEEERPERPSESVAEAMRRVRDGESKSERQ